MCKILSYVLLFFTFFFIVSCEKKKQDILFCSVYVKNYKPNFNRIAWHNYGQYIDGIYKHKIILLDKSLQLSGTKLTGEGDILELTILDSTTETPDGIYKFSNLEQTNILFNGYFAKKYNPSQQTTQSMTVINNGEIELIADNENQTLRKLSVRLKTSDGDSIKGTLLLPFLIQEILKIQE